MKSHHMNRRDVLRGGGIALALPFLNSMSRAAGVAGKKQQPKRMLISYIAYGVYDPNMPNGKGSSHEWSWFPRHDSGLLTLNKSSAPFEAIKDSLTYLRGLDHPGGYGLGGHSSGDVFCTGTDMFGLHKTNNISLDQLAAKINNGCGDGQRGRSRLLRHV